MYVTVYLTEAKKHTVIPHEYIYELVEVNLFNKGINTNQNRRVYFSKDVFDAFQNGENPNLLDFPANFGTAIAKVYPLPNDLRSACYIARLVKFWCKLQNTFYFKHNDANIKHIYCLYIHSIIR